MMVLVQGNEVDVKWDLRLRELYRANRIMASDLKLPSTNIESILLEAEADPEGKAMKACKLAQRVLVELMGRTHMRKNKHLNGVLQKVQIPPKQPGGKPRWETIPETRSPWGVRQGEGNSQVPGAVSHDAAHWKNLVENWECFKDLLPRCLFLDPAATPGHEITEHPNIRAFEAQLKSACSPSDFRRKSSLELIKKIENGSLPESEKWNGLD